MISINTTEADSVYPMSCFNTGNGSHFLLSPLLLRMEVQRKIFNIKCHLSIEKRKHLQPLLFEQELLPYAKLKSTIFGLRLKGSTIILLPPFQNYIKAKHMRPMIGHNCFLPHPPCHPSGHRGKGSGI